MKKPMSKISKICFLTVYEGEHLINIVDEILGSVHLRYSADIELGCRLRRGPIPSKEL